MNINSIKQLTQDVINGDESALKVFGLIKQHLKEVEVCLESVKDKAVAEAESYENEFKKDGFAFEKRAGSRRFDFKEIPEWIEKYADLKAVERKAKAAFGAYQNNLNTADNDGEVQELPSVSYSKDVLIVKASL